MKSTIEVKLPMPVELPGGEVAEVAVIRMLKLKERRELRKRYANSPEDYANEALYARLIRLGSLSAPVPRELIDDLEAPIYDELQEATLAQDLGYDTLDEFRKSDRYDGFRV